MRPSRVAENKADFEDLLAELTATAYQVALSQGIQGSFLDVELALWRELRPVVQHHWPAIRRAPLEDEPPVLVDWSGSQAATPRGDGTLLVAGGR
jgi:hypothetical protein